MTHCAIPEIPLSERRTFTMGEVAALLGVSVATLYAERARGRLRTIRLAGRRLITREALNAYVATARRDVGQSDMGPEAERLLGNEQQCPRASALTVAPASRRQMNQESRPNAVDTSSIDDEITSIGTGRTHKAANADNWLHGSQPTLGKATRPLPRRGAS
jgi:excisionase family DNA binding protein